MAVWHLHCGPVHQPFHPMYYYRPNHHTFHPWQVWWCSQTLQVQRSVWPDPRSNLCTDHCPPVGLCHRFPLASDKVQSGKPTMSHQLKRKFYTNLWYKSKTEQVAVVWVWPMLFYMLASSAPLMWHVFIRKERYVSICVTAGIATLLRIAYHFLTKCSKSIQDWYFCWKRKWIYFNGGSTWKSEILPCPCWNIAKIHYCSQRNFLMFQN